MPELSRTRTAATGVRRLNRAGFGVGGFGIALSYMTIGQLLFYFYTEVFHLTAAQAGGIIAVATFWDAIVDPIMAWIISRTNTSIGRYRPYLIVGAVPMSVTFVLMFLKPDIPGVSVAAFALVTHLMFRTAYQVIYMPYTAMVTRLTSDADERSDLEAWRAWFLALGILFVSFFGLVIVDWAGQGDDYVGFLWLAVIVAILSSASIMFSGIATSEDASVAQESSDVSSVIRALSLLLRNRPFLIVLASSMLCGIAITMFNKVTVDFFHYHIGDRSSARYALSASSLAGLLVSPLWAMMSRRTGKRLTWMAGSALAATAAVLIFVADPKAVPILCFLYFCVGAGLQAYLIIQFAAAADTVDFGEWRTGERVEALLFGMMVFANKTSLAIGAALVGLFLTWAGFVPGSEQGSATLTGLRATMLLMPALTLSASVIVVSFFPISTLLHRKIRQDLETGRRGGI